MIPYGKQSIDDKDIQAVLDVLRSDFLTTGPKIAEFEQSVADYVGVEYGVAVANGTAALHCAMNAIGIGPGDEVIIPVFTFAATANCVIYQGGTPVFVDVVPETLLINPEEVERKITDQTKAIISVDFAGQSCNYDRLQSISQNFGLYLVSDSCHALGAEYKNNKLGSLSDLTVFSFHPVKHITTGEGGMIVTNNNDFYEKMKRFRNHGIDLDVNQRQTLASWNYQVTELGYNYRLTDIQCALGLSQMKKLPLFLEKRRKIAAQYDEAFCTLKEVTPLHVNKDILHAYHLYIIRIQKGLDRKKIFEKLRRDGIGVNVHYIPLHYHPFYQKILSYKKGNFPVAEMVYEEIISLPIFPGMTEADVNTVINSVKASIECN